MLDLLSAIAGILLSLVFSYFPGAKDWYGRFDATRKSLVMLGFLVLAALLILALACSGLAADFGIQATCDRAGLVALLRALAVLLVTNQSTFLISPQSGVSTETHVQ